MLVGLLLELMIRSTFDDLGQAVFDCFDNLSEEVIYLLFGVDSTVEYSSRGRYVLALFNYWSLLMTRQHNPIKLTR